MDARSPALSITGRMLWIALTATLGYIGGFLFLELVGWVIDPVILLLLLARGRRRRLTPDTLMAFGLGFTAFVDVRLWGNLFLFRDPSLLGWTIFGLVLGPAVAAVGLWLSWRQRRVASRTR